jgi:MoaA/NifB/PqqE/SkfB family radical SAM enzyme
MSVRNCMLPWHWMLVTHEGDVLPCGHGSSAVGNLRTNTAEEIWNGELMQGVRSAIITGVVHPICQSPECPYQADHPAFSNRLEPFEISEELAENFDEDYYLESNPDVRDVVETGKITSGLEHFVRHGRSEGRLSRLFPSEHIQTDRRKRNASLAFLEYSRKSIIVRHMPVDIVVAVTTICNLRCVMCPHGLGIVEKPRNMPLDSVCALSGALDTVSRMIVSGVGEPTISPAFWNVLERFVPSDAVFIRVNTNALLITPEKAQAIASSALSEISISLDAASASTYTRIRGGNFERALAGIRMLVQARCKNPEPRKEISINLTLMRENFAELADFVRLGKELGVEVVVFSQLFSFGDLPDWKVVRGDYEFRYSESMPMRHAKEARAALSSAQSVATQLGMAVRMIDNVDSYLTASGDEEPVAA